MKILHRIDSIPVTLKALVSFGIGIGGFVYLSTLPRNLPSKYTEFKGQNYRLIDADLDGDVDKIIDERNPTNPKSYVADDMVQYFRDNGEHFIDFMGLPPTPSSRLQELANEELRTKKSSGQIEIELEYLEKAGLNKRR